MTINLPMHYLKALFFTIAMTITCAHPAISQPNRPCETEAGKQFDFWLGEWDLTWPGGQAGTPEGETGRGTNVVTRELGDCIIQERFSMPGYEGMSVSTIKRQTGKWHQTWVDSNGGYLALTGEMRDGVMELRTEPFTNPSGDKQINRMIFSDIEKNSLLWRWQRSLDGGANWEDAWVIQYSRKRPAASN